MPPLYMALPGLLRPHNPRIWTNVPDVTLNKQIRATKKITLVTDEALGIFFNSYGQHLALHANFSFTDHIALYPGFSPFRVNNLCPNLQRLINRGRLH